MRQRCSIFGRALAGNWLAEPGRFAMRSASCPWTGVRCTHCHVERDFSSDDKRPKRAARDMAMMHWTINQTLGKMKTLESEPDERLINCATCHRGATNPHDAQP